MEKKVHEAASILIFQIKISFPGFFSVAQKVLKENLRSCIHAESRGIKKLHNALDLTFFSKRNPILKLFPGFHSSLVNRRDQPEFNLVGNLLRRPFVDTLNAIIPGSDITLLLPIMHPTLNSLKIGHGIHEVSVR